MCEDALARDCDSINVETIFNARNVAGRFYFGGLRKIF